MRLILDPVRMAQLNVTPSEIAAVVREQNRDFPAGRIGREPTPEGTEMTIPVVPRAHERGQGIRRNDRARLPGRLDGAAARMWRASNWGRNHTIWRDVGTVKPNTLLADFLGAGANALETVRGIREEVQRLSKAFRPGVADDIPYDTTTFIDVSIKEVLITLASVTLLVILVVFVFLQSWRAT